MLLVCNCDGAQGLKKSRYLRNPEHVDQRFWMMPIRDSGDDDQ